MIPDAPGWWWLGDGCALVYTRPGLAGLWCASIDMVTEDDDGTPCDPEPVMDMDTPVGNLTGWLGPVAPPGSVSPEEHARAVVGAARTNRWWKQSDDRRALIARVGLAVVEGVER